MISCINDIITSSIDHVAYYVVLHDHFLHYIRLVEDRVSNGLCLLDMYRMKHSPRYDHSE